jgi:hypothetical protein
MGQLEDNNNNSNNLKDQEKKLFLQTRVTNNPGSQRPPG